MDFAMRLKEARKTAGLTQEQLADKCGLATITIRQYELGKREPRQETITKIADKLGTTPAFLMGLEGPYTADELIDIHIRGAKKWATDFRFSDQQKVRINELLAESALRLKELINKMADAEKADGKILLTPEIQTALDSISIWTANALKYVNNDYSDDSQA